MAKTIETKDAKDYDGIIRSVKIAMFPDREEEFTEAWTPVDGVRIDTINTGSWYYQKAIGISMKVRGFGKSHIRKVMFKDGTLDIDKCLAKFAELKALGEQEAIESKARQATQESLSAEVDDFFRQVSVPPGFVIRNFGDDKWTVKYEQTMSKEQATRLVTAIKRAIEQEGK